MLIMKKFIFLLSLVNLKESPWGAKKSVRDLMKKLFLFKINFLHYVSYFR